MKNPRNCGDFFDRKDVFLTRKVDKKMKLCHNKTYFETYNLGEILCLKRVFVKQFLYMKF